MTSTELPLKGMRVLDLTLARAGPTCVRHLADWGAEVIAVSPPDGGREVMPATAPTTRTCTATSASSAST